MRAEHEKTDTTSLQTLTKVLELKLPNRAAVKRADIKAKGVSRSPLTKEMARENY